MTRKVFNYGGGMHSPTALTAFLRDALDGDVADGMVVSAGSGMNVTVGAGTARVGRDPSYDINITGTETVNVGAASPSNPMNSLIVAYVDRSVAGSTSVTDNTNDVFKLKAVDGAAATSPADPSTSAIQAAIGATNPYIVLARVRKRAGSTSILSTDITDIRNMVTLKAGRISAPNILANNLINSDHLANGIVLPRHLSKTAWPAFRAVATAPQSFANSVFTQIMFHSEEYDTTNSFSNGTFTAPVSGIYRFDAILALAVPQGTRSIARFVIGDNDKNRFYDGQAAAVAGVVTSGSVEISMTAGQTAKVEAWKASGDGTQAGNSVSSFSGRLVLPT